jgi:hypothetical protein
MIPQLLSLVLLFSFAIAQNACSGHACNGHAELCDRLYSNVSQVGSHDSAFVGISLADNQYISVTAQLNFGIRFLQGQTHLDELGILSLCHTSCLLRDAGPLQSYLATVKMWLDNNPNEVLTLLLTNGDGVNISLFDIAFTASGIKHYAFVPPSTTSLVAINAWPTLQGLINSGKRLVVFLGALFPLLLEPTNIDRHWSQCCCRSLHSR